MILHASWNALFNSLTAVNESGNRNIAGFTGAMNADTDIDVQMMRLTQPLGPILLANNSKEVSIIHHPHNFGGTLLCPTHKVGCLVGMGPNTTPVVLDHQSAINPVNVIVPPIEDIQACLTTGDLKALLTPRTRGGTANLNGINCFFPAPFLRNAILLEKSPSPLNLVIAGRAAREEYVRDHNEDEGFDKANIDEHVNLFYLW
jgi:hypothetical protein